MHPCCYCHAVARVITKLVRKCTEGVRIIICLHCMVLWGCCSWGHNNSYRPIHVVKAWIVTHHTENNWICFKPKYHIFLCGQTVVRVASVGRCARSLPILLTMPVRSNFITSVNNILTLEYCNWPEIPTRAWPGPEGWQKNSAWSQYFDIKTLFFFFFSCLRHT